MLKVYIETYGCQMNFSDSEIIASVLCDEGYAMTSELADADVIFLNTCSIREHAEEKIFHRLDHLKHVKKKKPGTIVGLLGCMAERLKDRLFTEVPSLDLIAGPDSYRMLPQLLNDVKNSGDKAFNILLSQEETYAEINPVRINTNGVSAFISIMRGCENFCSYCVVPFTRGKERSRNPKSILNEIADLVQNGFKEVTLLGQNVNSFRWTSTDDKIEDFSDLLKNIAVLHPTLRIRFATSHPKDLSLKLIETIANHSNICRSVHLPVQSGSNAILERMNRKYSREHYLKIVRLIKENIPECSITTDIICGFPGETEEDHLQTLNLMEVVGFDGAFMFKYSERPGTPASKKYTDDISEEIKIQRLNQVIAFQQTLSLQSNKKEIGKVVEVLVEGHSKRSKKDWMGRTSQNKMVVFPSSDCKPGDFVNVRIENCSAATLKGTIVNKKAEN